MYFVHPDTPIAYGIRSKGGTPNGNQIHDVTLLADNRIGHHTQRGYQVVSYEEAQGHLCTWYDIPFEEREAARNRLYDVWDEKPIWTVGFNCQDAASYIAFGVAESRTREGLAKGAITMLGVAAVVKFISFLVE